MRANAGRKLIGAGIAGLLLGTFSLVSGHTVRALATPDPITFGTPTILDPVHTYGEPNIGINPVDGSMYDSGPEGTGVQRSGWEGSIDGGQTFRIVGQCASGGTFTAEAQSCAIPAGVGAQPFPGGDQITLNSAPGGGDAEQKFDSKGTQYFADLYALACQRVAYTSNDGATAPESPLGCGNTKPTCGSTSQNPCPGEGSDRQWLSVLDPGLIGKSAIPDPTTVSWVSGMKPYAGPYPLVYMEYNNLNAVQNECSTWLMTGNPGNGGVRGLSWAPANSTTTGNFGCDGYPSVDQYTGQVLEASTCSTTGSTNSICLNIGTPDNTGFLHFLDDSGGPGLITVATNLSSSGALLFVVSSIDSGQNLHVTWGTQPSDASGAPTNPNDWQIYTSIASATTGWTQWAPPVKLSGSGGALINIMPWIVAGNCMATQCYENGTTAPAGAGRSDTVWYGNSDTSEGPSSTSPGNQIWDVYMSQVVWPVSTTTGAYTGGTTGTPLSVNGPIKVTPHPMQYGGICLLGTGCITAQGNRNVADFFEVNIDKNGAAVVSYDDTADNLLQNAAPSTECQPVGMSCEAADHHGAAVITFARQTGGPGLLGVDVPVNPQYESATPTTGMNKTATDALYPVINDPSSPSTEIPALNFYGTPANQLSLSADSSTLTVTMHVSSLSTTALTNAFSQIPGSAFITYVTRWLMVPPGIQQNACQPGAVTPSTASCSMFYAMAEVPLTGVATGPSAFFYAAGYAQSVDLCSVSACFPHVVYYSEGTTGTDGGHALPSGDVTFDQTNGTITLKVPATDVGSPTQTSLLEEVGSYALVSDHQQDAATSGLNAAAQADDEPFEVDGVCCFNFQASMPNGGNVPESPWTPALLAMGAVLVAAGVVVERRRKAVRNNAG